MRSDFSRVSGKTGVFCVIGDPIEHTLSPAMYNACFREMGLDYVFVAFRVSRESISEAVASMKALDFFGIAVTIPHKAAILSLLDEIDPVAASIGAVNVICKRDSKLKGFNTDGIGARRALIENGIIPRRKKILMIGAGGAAKAIGFVLAPEVSELKIFNRTLGNAEALADLLRSRFHKRISAFQLGTQQIAQQLSDIDILINSTSVGLQQDETLKWVDPSALKPDSCVFDIITTETELSKEARRCGLKVVTGLDMLVYQGVEAFRHWFGSQPPVNTMFEAV
ncbi:MAG: shikimate dehydrogenase, partial [Candidatus Bathyarchaeia archaeon]